MVAQRDSRRRSPIPLYYQISNLIESRILTGVYPPGSRLGTEAELSGTFEVSRSTIRQALSKLEERGLLRRLRSRGTFVAETVAAHPPAELHGFLDDLVLQAEYAGTVDVQRDRVEAPADVARLLDVAAGSPLIRFRRVRSTSAGPHAYIENHLPEAVAHGITAELLYERSLLQTLDSLPGLRLAGGHQVIAAMAAAGVTARALGMEVGEPVLFVERVVHDDAGVPVELARVSYPGHRHRFRVHLARATRERGPGPRSLEGSA